MALDRTSTDKLYLTGRLIAITEHYASKHFGPGTLTSMFTNPAHGVDVFRRYIDKDDEYYNEIEVALPTTVHNPDRSKIWVGYYHQKAEYDDLTRGGTRLGAGRPHSPRQCSICIRISQEAYDFLSTIKKKSEYIDNLILCQATTQQQNLKPENESE